MNTFTFTYKYLLGSSAGGFGGFHLLIFQVFSCYFGFATDLQNWADNKRMWKGVG